MTDYQKAYIEQLSEKLKSLGDKIQTLKTMNAVPFSFYRDSFGSTQEITRLLHEMELLQINEMKSEMEKLIAHLSESMDKRETPVNSETKQPDIQEIQTNNVSSPKFDNPPSNGNCEQAKTESAVDIKQLISLNDRYLFQRELFQNDREKMDSFILTINAFDNFDAVEKYIGDNSSWDFEDETVKSFIATLKKGFE
ncbi:MAG: hypothetical protein LBR48_02475 [Dysgonamonadaceae bacterium]|jgi:hypothetical protein|nr:hypothetical protein [Dysgonamonadaceae bacterium]